VLKHHHRVANVLTKGVVAASAQFHLNLGSALVASGLCETDINGQNSNLSAVKFSRLLHSLAQQSNDVTMGMKCAGKFKLGDSGLFGLGMMNAPSFNHAIKFYVRFLALVADHAMFLADMSKETVLLQWKYSPFLLEQTQYVDFCIYLTLRQFRLFAGQNWSPRAIHLVRKQPEQINYLHAAFSSNLVFGAEANAMEISGASLALENPSADPRLFEHMERLCEIEIEKRSRLVSVEAMIADIVVNNLSKNSLTLSSVAKTIGLQPRCMQRKLERRGLSFEGIVQSAKQELSLTLLSETDLTIEQIAFRVGYESPNAFSRANQTWLGESPSVTRNRLLNNSTRQMV
jgi:AraC-like DNA-binding protein